MHTFSAFALLLLLVLVVLLWEVLKWLKLIGDILGCNPYRTQHIARLMKKLGYEHPNAPSKVGKEEHKELDEELQALFESEKRSSPAKAWQLIQLTERLDALIKLLEIRLGQR